MDSEPLAPLECALQVHVSRAPPNTWKQESQLWLADRPDRPANESGRAMDGPWMAHGREAEDREALLEGQTAVSHIAVMSERSGERAVLCRV